MVDGCEKGARKVRTGGVAGLPGGNRTARGLIMGCSPFFLRGSVVLDGAGLHLNLPRNLPGKFIQPLPPSPLSNARTTIARACSGCPGR